MDNSKILFCNKGLTLYHTISTFNNPKEKHFGKYCGKRRKCLLPAFSPFPTMFSTLSKTEIIILATFNLLSANAFNLDHFRIFSFGKELTHSLIHHFETIPNSKKLQSTTEMGLLKDFKIQIA